MAEEKKDQANSGAMSMPLTPPEMAWIDAYFALQNATEASERVYGPFELRATARTHGWRMLRKPQIKDEVETRLRAWRAARRMTVQEFGDQLADALQVNVADFYEDDGTMRPLSEIPEHARRQIAAIETEEIYNRAGELHGVVKKFKLWDRRKAEELWGKWQKMFTDKVEVAGEGGGPVKVAFSLNGIAK